MPPMIAMGSRGPAVTDLQQKLNRRPPSSFPHLAVDGIFGPKTQARVKEFQRHKSLDVDGIVGPKTWAALEATPPAPDDLEPRTGVNCGCTDPGNQMRALSIQQRLIGSLREAGGGQVATKFAESSGGAPIGAHRLAFAAFSLPSLPSIPNFSRLTAAQQTTATGVYGSSLDFSRIFISDQAGAQNRPFTIAVPIDLLTSLATGLPQGHIQIMNCGTLTPVRDTLIHELAHVWQSQHATNKMQFMTNAVASQALALALSTADGDNSNGDFPVNYPFSAYAFKAGSSFSDYAAEQIANQVEKGEATIVSHVAGVAAGAVDSDNDTSLTTPRAVDRRLAGVRC